MIQAGRVVFTISNEAVATARQQMQLIQEKARVLFGNLTWEGYLIQQQDVWKDERSLGHVILARILAAQAEMGRAYAQGLRKTLTAGLYPLYYSFGNTLPFMNEDDLFRIAVFYPEGEMESQLAFASEMEGSVKKINNLWWRFLDDTLRKMSLRTDDRHFVLLIVRTAIDAIRDRIAMKKSEQDGARSSAAMGAGADLPEVVPVPPQYTFADIGGFTPIKQEFEYLAQMMNHPEIVARCGMELPRGIFLVGPPGVGKTMFVHACASAVQKPYYEFNQAQNSSMFINRSAMLIDHFFDEIKKAGGGIVCFDEAEATLTRRDGQHHSHEDDKVTAVLNRHLQRPPSPDGLIIFLAANVEHMVDPATIRAGRVDKVIRFHLPGDQDREAVLAVHMRKAAALADRELFWDDILPKLIAPTKGFSCAELKEVVRRSLESLSRDVFDGKKQELVSIERMAPVVQQIIQERRKDGEHHVGFDGGRLKQ